ncbi:MAG: plasmid replication protein, CyRepA1 family [Xenococcus sp. (in: cyanobacteria)]
MSLLEPKENAESNFADPNGTTRPNHIQSAHWHEWVNLSAIDPLLTILNVISLIGLTTYEYLLYGLPESARRNDGRLRDQWLNRYGHLEFGGWWVSGLDPLNNWQPMLWGRFKSDNPRLCRKKNKPIKYESPPKVANRLTYFDVPSQLWDKVAQRYGIKRYPSDLTNPEAKGIRPICFWEWVRQHPEIPIILTEGEKKAACLLGLGFVAIACPGIWGARVGSKHNEKLHPDLLPMAQAGRKFTILFDYETKSKTRYAVYQATLRTSEAIEAAGCECEIATLPGPEKGVDDFVAIRGESAGSLLTEIIEDALSLKEYRQVCYPRPRGLSNKYPPNLTLNTRYLSESILVGDREQTAEGRWEKESSFKQNTNGQKPLNQIATFPNSGLIALWSGMGTGKTQLMALFRQLHPQMRFLNLGHRVNLLKNLSERLKTQMYSDLEQGKLTEAIGLSITIDSLYKLQNQLIEYGCVFIDEACQYLAHLLHSKTCALHRAEILEVLEYIVGKAQLVVLADAHMDDVTLDFFRAMRPDDEVPFIIKNDYKQPGRIVYLYDGDDSTAIVSKIFMALMLKLKIMVVSDSKKFIKKLETAMTVKVFDEQPTFGLGLGESINSTSNKLRIWSIHAENSGSEENIAFIKDISSSVKNVDVLLASPSLGTGVDISGYHFDAVFGVFHAVSQTATECGQSLHRVREQVPLHIWVAPRPPFGYKETNANKIKERMLNLNEMTAFLIRIDRETGKRGAEKDWAMNAYCEIEANRNRSINNLRDDLRSLLTEMEYNIIPVEAESNQTVKRELREAGLSLDAAHATAVVQANNISSSDYLNRQSKNYLSPEEIVECQKYRIQRDYGMPVTEGLVQKDDGGHLISKLIALEAILAPSEGEIIDPDTGKKYPAPPTLVAQRDLRERDNLSLCMDWQNYSGKWLARHILGIPKILSRLLAGSELCATDPDLVQMTKIANASRVHLKAILGFTVPPNCKPMWLLSTLIDQLGLKLISRRKGSKGQQVRYYSLTVEDLSFAIDVLQHREQQRMDRLQQELERKEKSRIHQAKMQTLYGIDPPNSSVVTPPIKGDIYPLEPPLTTENNSSENREPEYKNSSSKTLDKLKPCLSLLEEIINIGQEVLKEMMVQLSANIGNPIVNRFLTVCFTTVG